MDRIDRTQWMNHVNHVNPVQKYVTELAKWSTNLATWFIRPQYLLRGVDALTPFPVALEAFGGDAGIEQRRVRTDVHEVERGLSSIKKQA